MADIIDFNGPLSSGKTLTAVTLIKEDLKDGKKIVSTIQLTDIPAKIIPAEDLADWIIQNYKNEELIENTFSWSTLFIDEIRTLISSRKSNSNLNEIITQFLMNVKKLDCSVYYTTQRFKMVDVQLRQITDYVIECSRRNKQGHKFNGPRIPYITPEGKIIPQQKAGPKDKLYPILIRNEIFEVISEDEIRYTGKHFTYDPKNSFSNYNTREIVIVNREKYLRK